MHILLQRVKVEIIDNKKVVITTSNELKEVLENDNGYEYVYLENDIILINGININKNKEKVTIRWNK